MAAVRPCMRQVVHLLNGSHIADGLCCSYGTWGSNVPHLYRVAHDTSTIPQALHPLTTLDCERGTATCVHATYATLYLESLPGSPHSRHTPSSLPHAIYGTRTCSQLFLHQFLHYIASILLVCCARGRDLSLQVTPAQFVYFKLKVKVQQRHNF